MKKIVFLLIFLSFMVIKAQTTNNIQSTTYKVASSTEINTPSINQANQSVTHFDGLGRPMQSIEVKAGGNSEDIVTPITYDNFGRQTKEHLPYAATSNGGLFRTDALNATTAFYNTSKYEYTYNPFSEKQFEASPLNRVLKQAAPGANWALGSGHEIKMDYQANIVNEVRNFKVSLSFANNTYTPTLTDAGFYAPNELYKTVTYDENTSAAPLERNGSTVEFKNKQGQVILKRTYSTVGSGTSNEQHDTYYVYDDFGNLTYVLPPKMTTESLTIINVADNYDYQSYWFDDYPNLFVQSTYDNDISVNIYNGYFDITINAYADELQFKDGFIMNLDFITPMLPDMDLGHVTFGNGNDAGSAYISSGNLYINSSGLSDTTTGYFYGSFSFDLSTLQSITSTSSTVIGQTVLDDLAYQYKYDDRNRLVEKKLPGKQWEFIVYDKLDRVVATGPALSPFNDTAAGVVGWMITKYDVFSRPVYTGWEQSTTVTSAGRATKQTAQNAASVFNETKQTSGTIDGISVYYSNAIAPTSFKLLTVNYYDNYTFPGVSSIPTTVETQNVLTTAGELKGLATGSWARIPTAISGTQAEIETTFYDKKARPIRAYSTNFLGGYTYIDSKLDFIGKPEYTITYHKRLSGDAELKTKDAFTYSPQGRLLTQTHQINDGTVELIANNSYDELGQLITKEVGGDTQKVNYTYNIRGWLKGINDITALQQGADPKDLFAFKINYNTIPSGISGVSALYNGNIAETQWATNSDNGVVRTYGYQYDNLNRLRAGIYKKGSVLNLYNESMDYDKNGNIKHLTRYGSLNDSAQTLIDNLTYNYANSNNSNQLISVDDTVGNNSSFINEFKNVSGTDYSYDANGNMLKDLNKGIGITTANEIKYNHLNLPTKITFGTAGNIVYLYNAVGQKVQKVFTQGTSITTTDYLGAYQYVKVGTGTVNLKFFPTAEGYVEPNGSSYKYVYQYKDHLGNVRLSYDKTLAVQEENDYYPFGLKHTGYGYIQVVNSLYKYKYNGKEFQDELGLNMYDYGFRNYDPAIGRFMNVDPLAEISRRWSPYTYTYNNPVLFIDVDGLYVDTSWIYRKNKDGNYVNKNLVEAFEIFAKSKDGINFLSNFAEKGQVIAGHEYTESGKFDKKDIDLNYAEAKSEESIGDAYTSKETKGKKGLQITINLFPTSKTNALIDDIGHESFLHAEPIAKDFDDDKKFNLSPIDKDIVKQLEDENYPKKWRENAAHHMQDMRYKILDKKVVPMLRNYYNSKNIKKTDAQIRKERPRGY